jgi:anaerobic selenocysteine-containing dehydrogenase
MNVCPDLTKVREGFQRDDLFVCVHEQFMTDTAKMADVVLPATTFLEHDDFYKASGHTFLQVTRKVVEPFGEARSNHWVLCELAKRLGADNPGFRMTEWELMDPRSRPRTCPMRDAPSRPLARLFAQLRVDAFPRRLRPSDGKFRFKPVGTA